MLLPGLKGHPHGRFTIHIFGKPDDPSRDIPFIGFPGGKKGCMGSAITKGDAESLRGANYHIGTVFPWGSKQRKAQDIGGHCYFNIFFVR